MNILKKKGLIKLIAAICVFLTLFNFMATNSYATDGEILGSLGDAVMTLFVGIGDGVMSFLQRTLIEQDTSIIHIEEENEGIWRKIVTGVVVLAVAVVSVAVIAFSGGTALTIIGMVGSALVTTAVAGGVTYYLAYPAVASIVFPDEFYLPMYNLTPYEIFSNKLYILDVNFFNPKTTITTTTGTTIEKMKDHNISVSKELTIDAEASELIGFGEEEWVAIAKEDFEKGLAKYGFDSSNIKEFKDIDYDIKGTVYETEKEEIEEKYKGMDAKIYAIIEQMNILNTDLIEEGLEKNSSYKYTYTINSVKLNYYLWDVDGNGYALRSFTSDNENYGKYAGMIIYNNKYTNIGKYSETITEKAETKEIESTASQLQGVISKWYTILRNVALVILLSVLVYVGIRMLMCSVAAEKAKYKNMLVDWLVSLCLLFVMHYIMSFSMLLVERIIDVIDTFDFNKYANEEMLGEDYANENMISGVKYYKIEDKDQVKLAWEQLVKDENSIYIKYFRDASGNVMTNADSEPSSMIWTAENFMQMARMEMQSLEQSSDGEGYLEKYESVSWKIIFCVLVIYTIIFLITYIKRVIYIAFLTMIAPLVAMTYPIDKINDGKAQAFDMWFKEYIFNLLIQPFHLLLYMILVGSAMEFATNNPLYVMIALGFMIPAEKILRRFFGFDKAQTPGLLAGAAGGALMMSGLNRLFHKPPHKGAKPGNVGTSNSGEKEESEISASSNYNKYGISQKYLNKGDAKELKDDEKKRTEKVKLQNNKMTGNGTTQKTGANSNLPNSFDKKDNIRMKIGQNAKKLGKSAKRNAKRFVIGGAKRNMNKYRRYLKDGKPLKSVARLATGGLGAAVGIGAGTLAGIVSGDPSKAASYILTGGVAGYNMTDELGEKLVNYATDEDARNKRKEERILYSEGASAAEQYKRQEFKERFKRNPENINYLKQQGFTGKEAREILNRMTPGLTDAGITDIKDAAVIAKYQKATEVSDEEAINRMVIAKEIGGTSKSLGNKEYDEKFKKLTRILGSEEKAKEAFKYSDEILRYKK